MNHLYSHVIILVVTLCSLVVVTQPSTAQAAGSFRLEIPSLKINVTVVTAPVIESQWTWDMSRVTRQAAHLQGRPLPGSGSNIPIGAHSELSKRKPGPFYTLHSIKYGDEVIVSYKGKRYIYQVSDMKLVDPKDIDVISATPTEILTLITCGGYSKGAYTQRLIVQAALIRVE